MSNEHYFREGVGDAPPPPGAATPVVLAVDTATGRRGVALLRDGHVIAERSAELREAGAASVLAEIDEVLRAAGVPVGEVGLFAAAVGPGSFTGLRAGIATLKALAVTLGRPAVGVPTLHAVAYAARPAGRLAALIPAGRGEVFAQFLSVNEDGEVRELTPPAHLPPARLFERASEFGGGLKWAGEGSHKYLEAIGEAARARGLAFVEGRGGEAPPGAWALAPEAESLARDVALLALARWRRGAAAGARELRALYVRPSDAELHEQCQQPG
jgi:tRNA threonylcarbamoyladenosine biosynthesis protein TsaB